MVLQHYDVTQPRVKARWITPAWRPPSLLTAGIPHVCRQPQKIGIRHLWLGPPSPVRVPPPTRPTVLSKPRFARRPLQPSLLISPDQNRTGRPDTGDSAPYSKSADAGRRIRAITCSPCTSTIARSSTPV